MTSISNPAIWLAGYIPDIPTPFDEHGALDLAAFAMLCQRQIDAGVTAILVSETGGEASTLTPAEQEAIIRTAVDVARGRVRVIAGAGSNSTRQAIELTQRAEAAGADAMLSVVPYYNKPTQAGIQAHFSAIAISTALPIILHDVPSRTMRELSDDTLVQLANSRHFIGLKDTTGDIPRLLRLRGYCRPGFGCYPETMQRRCPTPLMAGTVAFPSSRTSRLNCARPCLRIAGWRGRRLRDTCNNGWHR